jgi:uncharacterized membrane protein YhaH (DUF805 family)
MKKLLFSSEGRITRRQFWLSVAIFVGVAVLDYALVALLWTMMPGNVSETGEYSVNGVAALPFVLLGLGYFVFCVWAGICVNAKRCHDRNKSGWFMLVQLIPLVGAIWYLVEAGFLPGTSGPNKYGSEPVAA